MNAISTTTRSFTEVAPVPAAKRLESRISEAQMLKRAGMLPGAAQARLEYLETHPMTQESDFWIGLEVALLECDMAEVTPC
jgi:hypothetical protein